MTHSVEISDHTVTKHYTSWSRNEPTREWQALTLLTKAAPDLTPAPLTSSATPAPSPAPSPAGGALPASVAARAPWVTMTVVPGHPLAAPLTSAQTTAVGDALEILWSAPADGLPQIDLQALADRTRTALTTLRSTDGVIAQAARTWLDNEPSDLAAVHDPVIAHGDPNLTNYLWDGRRVRIVDFEDAGLGDRTVELANLVEHLSWRDADPTPLVRRFAPDPQRFRHARYLWAGFWLTLIGPGGPSAHRNPPGTAEAQAHRLLRLAAE